MARTLKVFAADLGFVRAVVAVSSRKAALEAWGVRDDLFARGSAREITGDDALMAEARAAPGEVLRKPVGSGAELLAAAAKPKSRGATKPDAGKPKPAKTTPPPSRDSLEAAEAALKAAEADRSKTMDGFDAEQADLDRRRAAAAAALGKAVDAKAKAKEAARAAYDRALKAWDG